MTHQNILQFQVSVDDGLGMQVLQRAKELTGVETSSLVGELADLSQVKEQCTGVIVVGDQVQFFLALEGETVINGIESEEYHNQIRDITDTLTCT